MSTDTSLFHCKYDGDKIQQLEDKLYELTELVTTVNNTVSQGSVKKVQRGIYPSGNGAVAIDIEPVNPEKCHVTLFNINPGHATGNYVISLSETALTVGRNYSNPIPWEIVEYY